MVTRILVIGFPDRAKMGVFKQTGTLPYKIIVSC